MSHLSHMSCRSDSLLMVSFAAVCSCMASLIAAVPKNPFFAMDTAIRNIAAPIESKLDTLHAMGYAGLSWNGTDAAELHKVGTAAAARGLKLYALYVACPLTAAGIQLPSNFDELCSASAAHQTVIWFYMEGTGVKPSDQAADAIAVPGLQAAADRAARHGVELVLYPHRGYWVERFEDAVRVAGKVDRPNLGVSFNLCPALAGGEEARIPDLLRRARPRLLMVTINGADTGAPGAGWDRLIQPLGRGSYDVEQLMTLLQEMHYDGPVGFQAFGIKGDPIEILRTTKQAWDAMNPEGNRAK